ncbi:MAG: pro-sigmaK processing inhibitor BofA family protein [Clostridia bacterium]|nr:pro-sigmaK processing inhibitor BofA family protein [Clostridia bacterium]
MKSLLIILGVILGALFFLNIKSASEVFSRIICGFCVLLVINSALVLFSAQTLGINLITALITGIFGAPGVIFILAAALIL